jgi:thymidine phosphorylase
MIFNPVHLIQKKRNGEELNSNEIEQFIQGITHGSIPDYQASAFLMAVFFSRNDHSRNRSTHHFYVKKRSTTGSLSHSRSKS